MNFFIRKNSTLPELNYLLTQKIREDYNITDDMLLNIAVTFSMINENGQYIIANSPANIDYIITQPQYPNEYQYILRYKFNLNQTKKVGNYIGEFCLDFLNIDNGCGKIKIPNTETINIIIGDSITKTTVI